MNALENAQALFEELESLRPLSKEDEQRIMQKFRLDWNYHSNHLEGNQLTYGETKALILFNITAQGKPLKDHIEMTGHNEAIEWIIDVIKEGRPMTENFIKQLHELLLKEPYEVEAITPDGRSTKKLIKVGDYKSTPNHVKTNTGEIFRFASPEETPGKMYDLLEWYRAEKDKDEKNPIILATEFHYKFIRIHPFDDGNGRLARILMNFILMSFHRPPVVIKTEDKENYFAVLRLADADQFEPFVIYIAENLAHSLELMIKGAKGESVEEPDDLEKEIAILYGQLNRFEKIKKSKESITEFLLTNASQLYKTFYDQSVLFDKFYFERKVNFAVNKEPSMYYNKSPKVALDHIDNITDKTNLFTIYCKHNGFKTDQLQDLDFYGEISFEFLNTKVLCYSNHPSNKEAKIIKQYGAELSQEEINILVRGVTESHKSQIQKALKGL